MEFCGRRQGHGWQKEESEEVKGIKGKVMGRWEEKNKGWGESEEDGRK